jgi:hypothetical protein
VFCYVCYLPSGGELTARCRARAAGLAIIAVVVLAQPTPAPPPPPNRPVLSEVSDARAVRANNGVIHHRRDRKNEQIFEAKVSVDFRDGKHHAIGEGHFAVDQPGNKVGRLCTRRSLPRRFFG